ncbi:MAG: hypothetical protein FJ164_08725 [Gammaproteobacteria bacterium]|nr:hypothetical protein [Gammaproteobacteria bacterium]
MKRTLRAFSIGAVALSSSFLVSAPAEARIQIDALGGEVEINGFLSSEARARVGGGESYLNQWIQRLQIEASANYEDVGVFDTLSFVTVVRPEFDAAYYYGDDIASGRHRGGDKPSYMGSPFNFQTDPVGFGGFDYLCNGVPGLENGSGCFSTGGINKFVQQGLWNPAELNNFEVILNRAANGTQFGAASALSGDAQLSGFPLFVPLDGRELACRRCTNVDNDLLDIAMNNNDSTRLYPFRELYVDATVGDWWFRVGKQQIVWGKTDFFRLQDIINPVDFGQHFFFDSFEDIRIPQWIASAQWKFGDWGPTTDNAIQFVWNFDEFQGIGLGNPSGGWAHPFAKEKGTFAAFNHYFSVEPCLGPNSLALLQDPASNVTPDAFCGSRGPGDQRAPSGFGQPVGLSYEDRPEYELGNTEGGARWEFRLGELHLALSAYSAFNDVPVFRFHSVNVAQGQLDPGLVAAANPCGESFLQNGAVYNGTACNDELIFAYAEYLATDGGAGVVPITVMDPNQAIQAIAAGGGPNAALAQQALDEDNAALFYTGSASGLAVLGGQTDIQYQRSQTLGLSFDYFESFTGTVFRVESSVTIDELVNNTRKANWVDESEVMRWSIGIDRPTWIKWLNKDRTFFLSTQLFDTWYLDHEGDKHTGYYTDEHNFIWTFFFIGNYMRDRVTPLGFLVWEEASNSWVAGFNTEWKIDNHWSVKGGLHTIWGGNENFRHDSGPFSTFVVPFGANGVGNNYAQHSVFGAAHEGIGALRANDELFFQVKYQF